jgi:hypothetical protein
MSMLEEDARAGDAEARARGENPAKKGWTEQGGPVDGSQIVDESNESGPQQGLGGPPQSSSNSLGDHLRGQT